MSAAGLTVPRGRRRRLVRTRSGRIGLVVIVFLVCLAVFGPLFAPHDPEELLGAPYGPRSGEYPLGTDSLGRDVLSRVLHGGRSLIGLAVLSTAAAYLIGASLGLLAGFRRTLLSATIMRSADVLLALPGLLILLVLTAAIGPGATALLIGITIGHIPAILRVIQAATLDASVRSYVEAAVARGEPVRYILFREILPNITGTIAADAGPRLTISILAIASLNFLGVGLQPPLSDWALMINENRPGLSLAPWTTIVPGLLIALLTISVNAVADALARAVGAPVEAELLRR